MLLFLAAFPLLLLNPICAVVHQEKRPIVAGADCNGVVKEIIIPTGEEILIESGDIFQQKSATGPVECSWSLRSSNQNRYIIVYVEVLKLRNNGTCLDYLQFNLKQDGEWVQQPVFCDRTLGKYLVKNANFIRSPSPWIRDEVELKVMDNLPDDLELVTDIPYVAIVKPELRLRMTLHVDSPPPADEDNLKLVIALSTDIEAVALNLRRELENVIAEEISKAKGKIAAKDNPKGDRCDGDGDCSESHLSPTEPNEEGDESSENGSGPIYISNVCPRVPKEVRIDEDSQAMISISHEMAKGARGTLDCRWIMKASNPDNYLVAVVEKINMRKRKNGACLDYIQLSWKVEDGERRVGPAFCERKKNALTFRQDPVDSTTPLPNNLDDKAGAELHERDDVGQTNEIGGNVLVVAEAFTAKPRDEIMIHVHVEDPAPQDEDNWGLLVKVYTFREEEARSVDPEIERYRKDQEAMKETELERSEENRPDSSCHRKDCDDTNPHLSPAQQYLDGGSLEDDGEGPYEGVIPCVSDLKEVFVYEENLRMRGEMVFELMLATGISECQWTIKSADPRQMLIALVEELTMRKTESGECLDYIQFAFKENGVWTKGNIFCDNINTLMKAAGRMKEESVFQEREKIPKDEKKQKYRRISCKDSEVAATAEEGDLRILIHLGSPPPRKNDKLDFKFHFITYADKGEKAL